jgi:conjugative relaxase-like TrwC/TraI family protein
VIVSVTALGSRDGDAAGAVARVVDYLDGRGPCRAGRSPEWWTDTGLDGPGASSGLAAAGDGVVGYYADSVEGPGQWLGRGLAGFSPTGEVTRAELEAMLLGRHPGTGRQLLDARGSAARAAHRGRRGAPVAPTGPDDELVTLPQAATLLGVSPAYLRRLAADTAATRALLGNVAGAGEALPALDGAYLDATRSGSGRHWRVTRGEVARFDADRKAPSAVIAYDLTFSVPKSVSILWACADAEDRAVIVAAVEEAVEAGVAYLQNHAAFVRAGSGWRACRADGLLAASYLHGTSRALDPQLHAHVVVANMAESRSRTVRALDGRALFTHAKTAGYLAAAELRHQLAVRLGVEWEPAECGLADVAGVSREAIEALSKRSEQIDAVVGEVERFFTNGRGLRARGRQIAAYVTRAAKEDHGVDPAALRPWWGAQLDAVGFGPRVAQRCLGRQATPALVTAEDRAELFELLGSHRGVTEHSATFCRRDVLQAVAEWAGDRLGAGEIADLADGWLATEVVVRLAPARPALRPGEARRGVIPPGAPEPVFTTTSMLALEERLFATYERSRGVGAGVVPTATVEAALAARPELGEDQVAMVRSICTSGHRVQGVLGPAGSGKTFALATAARAWEAAGYVPVGATVQGTATEVLRDATEMSCSTIADLLTRLDVGVVDTLSEHHVVIVDESSTLSNRDLARLVRHVEDHGATLRLIGDPAQHSAVGAGGGWRALLERWPEDRAELVERRRQAAPEMTEVRLASVEYAAGHISAALERLRRDQRVVEAESADQLLDALVADWYVDRLRRAADPALAASSMTADHHVERRELNRRARALLAANGHLRGPVVEVAGQAFQAGDEVIDVHQDPELRPAGGHARDRVRTGERGVVVEVRPGRRPVVVVDFERRGRVEVAERFLAQKVRPGVVGVITHAYAVTTHMAQGETYEAARPMVTDASSREGVYVALTRGRNDVRLYVVRRSELVQAVDAHSGLPRLGDDTATVAAVTKRLESQRAEALAGEVDPDAGQVARLARSYSLAALAELAGEDDPLATRAYRRIASSLAQSARLDPSPALVARLGPRPDGGAERAAWDRAVGAVAVHRARFGAVPIDGGRGAEWALGVAPSDDEELASYAGAAEALARAERAWVGHLPVAALSAERRSLLRTLAATPPPEARDMAEADLARSRQALDDALAERVDAGQRLSTNEGRRWRRSSQDMEAARLSVAAADRRVAAARMDLSAAEAALGALERQAPDRHRVAERLELVEHVLDAKIADAVERPAPYLVAAIGTPDDSRCPRRWCDAAMCIEGFRHRELDRCPSEGSLNGCAGLEGAIGPRPDDYLQALAWDHIAELASPEPSLTLDVELSGLE